MSQQALQAVIGRAVTDGAFRDALFARPEATLAEYDLTPAEMAALRDVDFETLDACAAVLGERLSRSLTPARPFAVAGRTVGEEGLQ